MATVATPNNSSDSLAATARAIFIGLVWGALMLLVFGYWMRTKYEGPARMVVNVLFGGAAAAGLLAVWQAFTLWFKKETPDQKTATLEQQKRIFSYIFMAGGLALIVLAFYLGFGKRTGGNIGFLTDNFGESFGTLLFGLITLCAGYVLQRPPGDEGITVQALVDKVQPLKMAQLVIVAICMGTLIYVVYNNRADNRYTNYLPELGFLLAMSVLSFACFLYLNTGGMGEFGLRLFVLIFGGMTGLALFLWSVWRTIVWREDILLGGAEAWQGPNAWRFWLCAYVLFFSLILMFVSFNLAKADIRTNVTLRRVMYGYDAVVQGLLLVGILFILNIVVYALVPFTFDWTKTRGVYDLSGSTKKMISGLKQETHFIVLISQTSPVYKDLQVMLNNCAQLSNKLKVKYLSPDSDPQEYRLLANKFTQIRPDARGAVGRGVLIVNGPIPKDDDHKTPHAFVAERKLWDQERPMGPGAKAKIVFKAEGEIMRELKFLLQDRTKRKIYILQGNGEPSISNQFDTVREEFRTPYANMGIGRFVEKLKKDNYDVMGLNFGPELLKGKGAEDIVFAKEGPNKAKDVPEDCHTLIVAGVSTPLPPVVVDAVDRYMGRGGRMMVFLDVLATKDYAKLENTGLEPLLKRFGVEVTDQYVLQLPLLAARQDPTRIIALAPGESENPVARQFSDAVIDMADCARILKIEPGAGRYKAETILHVTLNQAQSRLLTIHETDPKALQDPMRYISELNEAKVNRLLNRESTPLAVAVSEDNGAKPRLVVFGDTDLITNRELTFAKSRTLAYDFTVSSMEWLAGKEEFSGARPKEDPNFALQPAALLNLWRMILIPGWLMLLGLVSLGICIWVVRRR